MSAPLPGPAGPPVADAERRLLAQRRGATAREALAFVDGLPGVSVGQLTGRWHGAGWPTGHPWDGVLEALGWWGKEFDDPEQVRPTLFRDAAGDPRPVNPALAPVALIDAVPGLVRHPLAGAGFRLALPLLSWSALGATRSAGRLRVVDHRGTPTAALVYDRVPIIDAFRRVTDDLVVGAADIRGHRAPLLFVLRRARPAAPAPVHRDDPGPDRERVPARPGGG